MFILFLSNSSVSDSCVQGCAEYSSLVIILGSIVIFILFLVAMCSCINTAKNTDKNNKLLAIQMVLDHKDELPHKNGFLVKYQPYKDVYENGTYKYVLSDEIKEKYYDHEEDVEKVKENKNIKIVEIISVPVSDNYWVEELLKGHNIFNK